MSLARPLEPAQSRSRVPFFDLHGVNEMLPAHAHWCLADYAFHLHGKAVGAAQPRPRSLLDQRLDGQVRIVGGELFSQVEKIIVEFSRRIEPVPLGL